MESQAACARCGSRIDAGARFCMKCGADVSGEQGHVSTRLVDAGPSPGNKRTHALLDALRDAALGEYEVFGELGSGGMATVFLAHDIQLDRKVALKVMLPPLLTGEGMVERFKLEARTAASLSHPHIIPIYAVKQTDDLLYFVMKFVDGRSLDSIIRELGPLPIPMVQTILTKVGEALGYAHRNGVVHRDIKPANIMVDVEGLPVVTDFGIAKVADTQGLTMTGVTVGTPTYMSPEQCTAGAITGASDQYSLGVVAYEMLTGQPPFDADTAVSLMFKHCHELPASLEDVRPDCPPTLAEAVSRMLAKEPNDRWSSMEEAIARIGFTGLAFGDPVRTQMIDLAKAGEHREMLRRISTPRSPMPVARTESKKVGPAPSTGTEAATVKLASAQRSSISAVPGEVQGKSTTKWWVMGIAATMTLLIAGGTLYVGRNDGGDTGAQPTGSAVTSATLPDGQVGQVSLDVSPQQADLIVGETLRIRADVLSESGTLEDQSVITWSSDAASIASVSASGLVTALAAGEAVVTVRAGDDTAVGRVPVRVRQRPRPVSAAEPATEATSVAAVTIDALPPQVTVGQSYELSARVADGRGRTMRGESVTWSSSDPQVLTVSATGVIAALAPGQATVTASASGRRGTATLRVLPEAVARVTISPGAVGPIEVGRSARLTARVWSSANAELRDRGVRWTTADAGIASVSADGVVRALAAGVTSVSGSVGGRVGTVRVEVVAPREAQPRTEAPDPAREIQGVVSEYALAIEARDIERVRRVFPGITAEQVNQLQQSFEIMRDLRVTLEIGNTEIDGNSARVDVSGTYEFYNTASRKDEQTAVSFLLTMQRGPEGWRITAAR